MKTNSKIPFNNTKSQLKTLVMGAIIVLVTLTAIAAPLYRPEQARRTINTDQYELVIQKNGQIDLLTLSGEPIVDNAFPSVILADSQIRSLAIDYRKTNRFSVRNSLGQGNGFLYTSPECEWRISTYPAEPFITVDLTFINHTSKPVTILGLTPFGIGDAGKGGISLGEDAGKMLVLQNASPDARFSRFASEARESPGHLAAYNPASGRVLVAGYLTQRKAKGTLSLLQTQKQDSIGFDVFDPVLMLDEPLIVGPGERVEADTLYLAIAESDPQEALERFAAAAILMEKETETTAPVIDHAAPTQPERPCTLPEWGLASRQYYLPATRRTGVIPWEGDLARATQDFDDNRFITALTLATLQGGVALATEAASGLSPLRRHILDRLQPPRAQVGRPIDLFQEGPPQQWYLRPTSKVGDWTIAALFNFEKAAAIEINTALRAIGLNDDNRYTVYDYWAGRYLGLIEKTLRVEVLPEGVRLIGLRHFENRPMLVASNRYFTQGASDHSVLTWTHATQTLTGTLDAVAAEEHTLTVLIPDPYTLKALVSTGDTVTQSQTDGVLTFTLRATASGPLTWTLNF